MTLQQAGAECKLKTSKDLKQAKKYVGNKPIQVSLHFSRCKTHVNLNLILIFTPLQWDLQMMVKRSLQE